MRERALRLLLLVETRDASRDEDSPVGLLHRQAARTAISGLAVSAACTRCPSAWSGTSVAAVVDCRGVLGMDFSVVR